MPKQLAVPYHTSALLAVFEGAMAPLSGLVLWQSHLSKDSSSYEIVENE